MTTRRNLIAVVTSAAVTAGMMPPTTAAQAAGLDGELLVACARLSALYAQIQRIDAADDDTPKSETEVNGIVDAWWEKLNVIIDTPARTPQGIQAKAGATRIALEYLATPMLDQTVDADGRGHERLAWSLVNDMLGEARS